MNPYTVTFVGDFFTMTTSVELDPEESDIAGKSPDELIKARRAKYLAMGRNV